MCQKRLASLLRKLSANPEKLKAYDKIIRDWEKDGVVESVERGVDSDKPKHYFPHSGVEKQDRATTQLRVCMDGSAHIRNHPSINETLDAGKCMLPHLFDVLIRFRCWMYALISDIKSAFLQIRVDERDRDYLRFFWIDDISKEIPTVVVKRFTSVLFGLKCSPFLLGATLDHHATKYKNVNPEFVEMFLRDLYMDDNTTGVNDVNTGFEYYLFVKSMLLEGGFVLRKWFSNSSDLLQRINHHEETVYNEPVVIPDHLKLRKVLGVTWDGSTDTLVFSLQELVRDASKVKFVTKRIVLSVVSGIFDPLGILSALVIILKFLFQEVCAMKVDWDVTLPEEFTSRWISALQYLASFEPICLPRHYLQGNDLSSASKVEIHGFSDASVKAIAVVIYLRAVFEDKAVCSIMTAKTKIVPLHQRKAPKGENDERYTVPKLELSGCLILSELMKSVLTSIDTVYKVSRVMCWTDSKDCVWWINKREKVRGRYVQPKLVKTCQWNHCPGSINPADIPSRGATNQQDVDVVIHGPSFLRHPSDDLFPVASPDPEEVDHSVNEVSTVNVVLEPQPDHGGILGEMFGLKNYSSFQRLLRVTCYVLRFIHKLRCRRRGEKSSLHGIPWLLHWKEMEYARMLWILDDQKVHFSAPKRLKELQYSLAIFRDQEGVLRVKGRLEFMNTDFNIKFPILIAKESYLTELIILDCHLKVKHSRVKDTLNHLRATFWVTQGRRVVGKVIKKCTLCPRYDSQAFDALPAAPLPQFRTQVDFPFTSTGVDYFGPLYVKNVFSEVDDNFYPVHVALFTCAVSRAVHLDIVPSTSCYNFVKCLIRFCNHYGTSNLYVSDNAKSFTGPELSSYLLLLESKWEFILPSTPWWGGYWERLVQSSKRCLQKILGRAKLNYEELLTALAEVEGVLNSRPLCHVYDDTINDVLTPSHLAIGRRLLSRPYTRASPESMKFTSETVSQRAKYLQSVLKHFWDRWVKEYLTELREFHMCNNRIPEKQVQVGDVVLVHDKLKRNRWRMAVVEQLYEGRDGFIRGCKVRSITKTGRVSHFDRPINKLYPLEVQSSDFAETDPNPEVPANPPTVNVMDDVESTIEPEPEPVRMVVNGRPRRAAADAGIRRRRELQQV